ncbi:hypothetical protein Tco_0869288 [Tanacetum coccineum]
MINFIDVSCKDSFGEVLRLKKSNHLLSGSTTPLSDYRPSLTSFETSDSLLEEFADELALLDPFPPGNEDVDFEADLKEIELLLNHDPSINFSPTITIDPNPERFTDKPDLACLPPPGDDDSFLKEDVQEENFQIYSNPPFEFDDNYNSSDINPLFNEILEDVESKNSNVSNFDKDECFDPGGEIDAFLNNYKDSEGDVLKNLHNTTHNLFPKVFFNHEPQDLKDEPNNDLMTEDKVFDPGVIEKIFFPSYVRLSSKDRHYLFFTIVFSFGSEDTIFDPVWSGDGCGMDSFFELRMVDFGRVRRFSIHLILSLTQRNVYVVDETWQYPIWGGKDLNLVNVEGICGRFGEYGDDGIWLLMEVVSGFGIGEVELSTFDVLQMFVFFLQMGFTLILATLDGLDVCLLGDVIGEDDGDFDRR